ncbi:MAG: peptidoglycan DD-metalloendopeptidase family protein [candidate division WOR-3 bacterium]
MITTILLSIPWPLVPQDQAHPVGNSWGEYQEYSGDPSGAYLHPGVDIMGVTQGKEVRAVAAGWVKAWMTISGDYHWRVATSDQNTSDWSDGWLYAHIDPYRYHVSVGDQVSRGTTIGYLVPWPVTGFDHCHFARIRHHGTNWNDAGWRFIRNPLVDLVPNTDTVKPIFESTGMSGSCKFAFRHNNSSTYLSPDSLYGKVDVIAKIYDKFGISWGYPTYERIGVYRISYEVKGAVPLTLSFLFRDTLNYNSYGIVYTIYEYDNYLKTQGDYENRDFFYIVTNTDGDSTVETSDSLLSWDTGLLVDGDYWFVVQAQDEKGNIRRDSCLVKTRNGNPAVEDGPGSSLFQLGPTVFRDATWLVVPEGWSVPTLYDVSGKMTEGIHMEGPGSYKIAPERPGVYFLVGGSKRFKLLKTD